MTCFSLRKLDDAVCRLWLLLRKLYTVYLSEHISLDVRLICQTSHFCLLPVPPNGLVVYCGTIVTEEGKEKKVNIDFEPFKPINTSLYLCDNKFHTEVRLCSFFLCLFILSFVEIISWM